MRSPAEHQAKARNDLLQLVETEHAVVWNEVEAKLTEENRAREDANFAHVLTDARHILTDAGLIVPNTETARGGTSIETFTPADLTNRATKVKTAAARKRLLMARYRGWASGNATYPHGLIGPAGEVAVRQALVEAGNLSLSTPGAGEVRNILGTSLNGSLDSGGWLPVMNSQGLLEATIYIPIEVKNVRDWLYPQSSEVFQLLSKAAQLQRGAPTTLIHPVLICRRANYTLFFMAKQLGFRVHITQQQYIRAAPEPQLAEIRTELGFTDLMPIEAGKAVPNLLRFFRHTLQKSAIEAAHTWQETVLKHNFDVHFQTLRDHSLRFPHREPHMTAFRTAVHEAGLQGGW
ncbi:hypothetical protein AB0M22_45025 [Nocardia sp. NPDC051756]|uniref:hypothetical protein n=1 Tax=Nocardia sp. NPDC051756 TaxID=3154751 RepID=UPI0034147ED9